MICMIFIILNGFILEFKLFSFLISSTKLAYLEMFVEAKGKLSLLTATDYLGLFFIALL